MRRLRLFVACCALAALLVASSDVQPAAAATGVPPTVRIDEPTQPVLVQYTDRLTGVATDPDSEILFVYIVYIDRQGVRDSQVVNATLTCDAARRNCTWSALLAALGNYRARAYIRDLQENEAVSPPVEVTVV